MGTTYSELIAEVRASVTQVSLAELARRIEQAAPMTLIDLRDKEDYRQGFIPGALCLPRGLLEMEIERRVPDKSTLVVLYCAVGIASALAVKALELFGYMRVETLDPGFVRWKELGYPVDRPPALSEAQRERYRRHLALDEVGEAGQAKLLGARVLVLGAGGLGSPAALYLAAAGVGTLGLIDPDVVELSNLQRQILHATSRLGQPKVLSAAHAIGDLNPEVKVLQLRERLDRENVARVLEGFDIVVDGSDNFPARYLLSDASVWTGIPVVHGSIFRFEGQVTTFVPNEGPCYRCLYPEPPPPELTPSCVEAGVLGVLPGLIGVIQATEVVKYLLGQGELLKGRLLCYDSLRMRFRELRLDRDPSCPVCGDDPSITEHVDYEHFCHVK